MRNKKGLLIGIVAIVIILVIGFGVFYIATQNNTESNEENVVNSQGTGNSNEVISAGSTPQTHTVEITSSGFSPRTLTIKQGDKVIWINKDSAEHWPASAMHPTHTVYPGSDIKKCGTAEQSIIFDSCKGISSGESWSFTFNEKGSWNYHDHLVSGLYGTIVVQ